MAGSGAALLIRGIRRGFVRVPVGGSGSSTTFRFTRRASVRDIFILMKNAPDLRKVLADAALPKFVA